MAFAGPSSLRENALIACLVGEASLSLLKKQGKYNSATLATEAAQAYADARCKSGALSEGGGDYVYHSIRAIAKWLYADDE